MTGKEEFEPLDELFRKTFQGLPDKPAASGWDSPSPRVWQRVQTEIKPPTSGWALQTWTFMAVLVVGLGVGMYYVYDKLQSAGQAVPAPVEQPVTPPPVAMPTQDVNPAAVSAEKPAATSASKTRPSALKNKPDPAVNSSNPGQPEPSRVQASPLPGSKTKSVMPNSTERQKLKGEQEN